MAETGDKVPEKEAVKEEKKVEIKPYKVFGQDFSLSDPDFIDYYKTRMKMMAIKYRLCGRINEHGQYKISDEVRYDLIKMEKEIEETGEDFYKAIALYMKKHFYFHIKITQMEDGKAKASLYLSEHIDNLLGLDALVSHVADFVDTYDDDFRIRVRKAFNLVDVSTKVDDFAVPNLAVVMQDAIDLELVIGGLYDMASQIFVMRLLKALEESGEGGEQVLVKYRELLSKNEIEINEKFRYSSYKALLDRAVDELGGYEKLKIDPNITKSIIKEINGTVKAIDNASGKSGYVEPVMPKIDSAKKSAGSKPAKSVTKKSTSLNTKKTPPKKKEEKKKDKAQTKTSGGVSPSSYDVKEEKTTKSTQTTSSTSQTNTKTEAESAQNPSSAQNSTPPPERPGEENGDSLENGVFNMGEGEMEKKRASVTVNVVEKRTQIILPNGKIVEVTSTETTVLAAVENIDEGKAEYDEPELS